jgi:hypothetical protein
MNTAMLELEFTGGIASVMMTQFRKIFLPLGTHGRRNSSDKGLRLLFSLSPRSVFFEQKKKLPSGGEGGGGGEGQEKEDSGAAHQLTIYLLVCLRRVEYDLVGTNTHDRTILFMDLRCPWLPDMELVKLPEDGNGCQLGTGHASERVQEQPIECYWCRKQQ